MGAANPPLGTGAGPGNPLPGVGAGLGAQPLFAGLGNLQPGLGGGLGQPMLALLFTNPHTLLNLKNEQVQWPKVSYVECSHEDYS